MIAVVKIGGHQALVQVGEVIEVDKIDSEPGSLVQFETLLVSKEDGSEFQMGAPVLTNVPTEAKVIEHGRGDKVIVFKMKPRKRYRRTRGHRQDFTVIEITKIGSHTEKAEKPVKVAAPKAVKPVSKTPEKPKTTKSVAKPKSTAKPVTAKKPAAKKKG